MIACEEPLADSPFAPGADDYRWVRFAHPRCLCAAPGSPFSMHSGAECLPAEEPL